MTNIGNTALALWTGGGGWTLIFVHCALCHSSPKLKLGGARRYETPVAEGDKLNLIAALDLHQGSLHAICNFSKGETSNLISPIFCRKLNLFSRLAFHKPLHLSVIHVVLQRLRS